MKRIAPLLLVAASLSLANVSAAQPQRILLIDPPAQPQQRQQVQHYVPRNPRVVVERVPVVIHTPPRVVLVHSVPPQPTPERGFFSHYVGLHVGRSMDGNGAFSSVGLRTGFGFGGTEIGVRGSYLFGREVMAVGLEVRHRFARQRVFQPYLGVTPGLTWIVTNNDWTPHVQLELQVGFDIQVGSTRFGLSTFSTLDYGPAVREVEFEKGARLSVSWVL